MKEELLPIVPVVTKPCVKPLADPQPPSTAARIPEKWRAHKYTPDKGEERRPNRLGLRHVSNQNGNSLQRHIIIKELRSASSGEMARNSKR
jgi:hypothetical protein